MIQILFHCKSAQLIVFALYQEKMDCVIYKELEIK